MSTGGIYWNCWGDELLLQSVSRNMTYGPSNIMKLFDLTVTSWPCWMDFSMVVGHLDIGETSWLCWTSWLAWLLDLDGLLDLAGLLDLLDYLTFLGLLGNWCNTLKLYCLYAPIISNVIFQISTYHILETFNSPNFEFTKFKFYKLKSI